MQILPLYQTDALAFAVKHLENAGLPVVHTPTDSVTHLLLDIPSCRPEPHPDLAAVLSFLPPDITVIGGNLNHPCFAGYRSFDLLRQETYLAQNAAITADCAIRFAAPLLEGTFADTPALILGWGRIGKCLAPMLRSLHCPVTVAARSEKDRSILTALGYPACRPTDAELRHYGLLFNTVPAPILEQTRLDVCPDLIKIELASAPGLTGAKVHMARGLPGRLAPRSSGSLIARTILSYCKEEHP